MRDPHVVALHYRLETGPQLAFNDPSPMTWDLDAFTLQLSDGQLSVEMKDHFATVDAAQREVEPYLRSWEIDAALKYGAGAMRFRFDRPRMIDRDTPPPGASSVITPMAAEVVVVGEIPVVRAIRGQYPEPPERFRASVDVVAMWERYEGYLADKEPLPAMAQYCLTVVEQSVGGPQARRRAANRYVIDYGVLSHLGYLASEVGDARTGRKKGRVIRPHTPAETAWMEAVVKRMIQRVGEWAYDPNVQSPQITREDFPRL